jgi:cytochrome P450
MHLQSLSARWRIPTPSQPLYLGSDGIWHVAGYPEARAILLDDVRQAGFKAEMMQRIPKRMRLEPPVLFQDGPAHREQRSQTARFFTPTAVQQRYVPWMEKVADGIIQEFRLAGQADLHNMTARMAAGVVAEVIGLTESPLKEMTVRLDTLLHTGLDIDFSISKLPGYLKMQGAASAFLRRDVRPAIRARRQTPREDVISHLLAKGRSEAGILIECITYGSAGMATTQEFLCVAVWHFLHHPDLREAFINGDREQRAGMLYELLRLEPVVGHLYRRAASQLAVSSGEESVAIPSGALIDFDLHAINSDPRAVGQDPFEFCPERVTVKGTPAGVMGFGSGPHRCAGEFLAIAESDVFLQRLLAIPGLRILQPPRLGFNETIHGYELREFIIEASE